MISTIRERLILRLEESLNLVQADWTRMLAWKEQAYWKFRELNLEGPLDDATTRAWDEYSFYCERCRELYAKIRALEVSLNYQRRVARGLALREVADLCN